MRQTIDLSGPGWKLWLDKQADWEHDELFLPPVDLARVPARPPTEGWDVLPSRGIDVSVPGTVEEYLWDTEGDYKGVSWWRREFTLPPDAAGQRLILQFEAVRLRAEVFLNGQLVGYDLVGNTPFEVDVTNQARCGQSNVLAVRVTDPSGNFDWMDFNAHRWGDHTIPASHGFGGITGPVRLLLVDPIYVHDVFVKNRPTLTDVEVDVTIRNTTPDPVRGDLRLEIVEPHNPARVVFEQTWSGLPFEAGDSVVTRPISVPTAEPWTPDSPRLYVCRARLSSGDSAEVRFGFRWFAPDGVGQDAVFRLNGRRIVLRSAISWGFWPTNGITPTRELAERQIRAAKELGLNMLNFHRCIGQPIVLDLADESGLLYYEEPGGYTAHGGDDFCFAWAREKLLRMVQRDRNHPALVIYNMINEEQEPPAERHKKDMADAHRLDPTRCLTYTSGWARADDDPIKLHMRPYDERQHVRGWCDSHNACGPGSYRDEFYKGPNDFTRFTDNRAEIVFWGEEGANAIPPRLERIVKQLEGARDGWDGADYKAWYEAYRKYLTDKSLWRFFPSIDDLTRSLGNLQYDYQGRIIENIRAGNVTDGYVINGWEDEKLENHSGVVDCFRNFKGDPQRLARYNAPHYVAVKLRDKVGHVPLDTAADFYVVNEVDLKGPHELRVTLEDAQGRLLWSKDFPVTITGGDTYGQLLAEGVEIKADCGPGRYRVRAELRERPSDADKPGAVRATGDDELFLVDWKSRPVPTRGAVVEQGDSLRSALHRLKNLDVPELTPDLAPLDFILIGDVDWEPQVVVPTECLLPAEGPGTGLSAEYCKGVDFHRRVLVRTDATIDFDFREAGPARSIGSIEYSVRWQGKLKPLESGEFVLYTLSDDGIRLWVDGTRVIDHWSSHGPVLDAATPMTLESGREYDIRVEFFQRGGGAVARLLWTTPSKAAKVSAMTRSIVDRVRTDGTSAIVLKNADVWARALARENVLNYRGRINHGKWWLGGNFFVREHPLLDGLPVNVGMNWEYQEFLTYDAERYGLLLDGEEAVVGSVSDHQHAVATAVGVVPCGKGRFVLCTLDVLRTLDDPPGPADVVRKLLCNLLAYAAPV